MSDREPDTIDVFESCAMSDRETDTIDVFERLREYVRSKEAGAVLDFVTVETDTGISMHKKSGGRELLRRALKKEGREFRSIRDIGVELSSASTAASFVRDGVVKVVRSAKKQRRRITRIFVAHSDEIFADDRATILRAVAFYGALEIAKAPVFEPQRVVASKPPPPVLPRPRPIRKPGGGKT